MCKPHHLLNIESAMLTPTGIDGCVYICDDRIKSERTWPDVSADNDFTNFIMGLTRFFGMAIAVLSPPSCAGMSSSTHLNVEMDLGPRLHSAVSE
jgi:hypothetical protein